MTIFRQLLDGPVSGYAGVYERALITPPEVEPVSKEEAKNHCNVDFDNDDEYLLSLITTARVKLEEECSKAFVTQSWEIYPPCFPREPYIKIPMGKLRAITSFSFEGADGSVTDWTVDDGNLLDEFGLVRAHIDTKSIPGRITLAYARYWPVTVLKTSNPITIGFDCGYGLVNQVPAPLKHAIKLLVEQWYKNRDVAVVGKSVTMVELPRAVDDLIANYRP